MAILPIIKLGHPGLRKCSEAVTEISDSLKELVQNMIDTMELNDGIGLAAPQVNVLKRFFVIDLSLIDETLTPRGYLNPRIVASDGSERREEGCLSIPDVRGDVTRPFKIEAEYQTLDGKQVQESMEGLLARVFQHELDHLDGVLFIDKISVLERKMLASQLEKIRKENSIS